MGRGLVEDRHPERLGQDDQRRHRARIAAGGLHDGDRAAPGRQHLGGALQGRGVGDGGGGRAEAGRIEVFEALEPLGQDLARQREVDGALWLAAGDGQRAIHDRLQLAPHAQLVVPLHELADHGALVERLLAPVDVAVPGAGQLVLGERGAAGGDEDRRVRAGGVDDPAERVGGADDHVHHDDLRPASDHGVAVGHADRGDLVRHRQRAGQHLTLGGALGVGLDDRREIRAGVREEVFDAPRGQQLQVGLGRALDRHFLQHGFSSRLTRGAPAPPGRPEPPWGLGGHVEAPMFS